MLRARLGPQSSLLSPTSFGAVRILPIQILQDLSRFGQDLVAVLQNRHIVLPRHFEYLFTKWSKVRHLHLIVHDAQLVEFLPDEGTFGAPFHVVKSQSRKSPLGVRRKG